MRRSMQILAQEVRRELGDEQFDGLVERIQTGELPRDTMQTLMDEGMKAEARAFGAALAVVLENERAKTKKKKRTRSLPPWPD